MLNYQTILSNYDDRLTLLEYLKKVEAALADASATSFSVTKTGSATIKFVLTFEDGTTLESPEIVLQQGESVASASIDANGHLLLTLTNGDVLDAGSMFDGNVSITGTLSAAGNTSLGGDLNVAGTSEFQDAAQFDSDVTIGGDVSTGDLTPSNLLIPITGSIKPASAGQTEISSDVGIVEKMTGYSVGLPQSDADRSVNNIYVGVCKNGNKLTFVIFGSFTKISANPVNLTYGFDIPQTIGSKLYPYPIAGIYYLENKDIQGVDASDWARRKLALDIVKTSDTYIYFTVNSGDTPTGTTAYFRVEQTFLLSPNLAA